MQNDIADKSLAAQGVKRIEWADRDMLVLRQVRADFAKKKPLKGKVLAACLHVTAETANLMRTLKAGGADVYLCASNPLSTQDDVAAALTHEYGIPVFAKKGEDTKTFFSHIETILQIAKKRSGASDARRGESGDRAVHTGTARKTQGPRNNADDVHEPFLLTMDDGADLVSTIHTKHKDLIPKMLGGTEETTTGVIRLRAMHKEGALKFPIVAVNDAKTKNMFDNRYGTGQSTLDGIIRATDILIAGKTVVTAGYGWCGKGFAMRARGMGANVVVTEIDPVKALEAVMDGFRVMPMDEAAAIGDLFCTVTGNTDILVKKHFKVMKDGAIICNSGHFDVEININDLKALASKVDKAVRANVDAYKIGKPARPGKTIYLLADGRLVNLAAAEGHPASVMDMSFATQALASAWIAKKQKPAGVYDVPLEIENMVATVKLASMNTKMDVLTSKQQKYLAGWQEGT